MQKRQKQRRHGVNAKHNHALWQFVRIKIRVGIQQFINDFLPQRAPMLRADFGGNVAPQRFLPTFIRCVVQQFIRLPRRQ